MLLQNVNILCTFRQLGFKAWFTRSSTLHLLDLGTSPLVYALLIYLFPVRSPLQVYRQDCETFGMVVKMLVAKDPDLEKQLQVPLRENLGEIRERCLEDLKHFISELDESVGHPEPLA